MYLKTKGVAGPVQTAKTFCSKLFLSRNEIKFSNISVCIVIQYLYLTIFKKFVSLNFIFFYFNFFRLSLFSLNPKRHAVCFIIYSNVHLPICMLSWGIFCFFFFFFDFHFIFMIVFTQVFIYAAYAWLLLMIKILINLTKLHAERMREQIKYKKNFFEMQIQIVIAIVIAMNCIVEGLIAS